MGPPRKEEESYLFRSLHTYLSKGGVDELPSTSLAKGGERKERTK